MATRNFFVVVVVLVLVHTSEAGKTAAKRGAAVAECKDTDPDDSCALQMVWYDICHSDWGKESCALSCGYCTPKPKGEWPRPAPVPCGKPDVECTNCDTRIIAGDDVERGSWPWQIVLRREGQGVCGGSLIDPEWVVTAVHCVSKRDQFPGKFTVVVGEHDKKVKEGSEETVGVEKIIIKEHYDKVSMKNDIALIKLIRPVTWNRYVKPICLPKKDIAVGTSCYLSGWGRIDPKGATATVMQQCVMPVVSNEVCEKLNFPLWKRHVTDVMICAGSPKNIKSGCRGDSGGPLNCKVDGVWELHGDASWTSQNCNTVKKSYTVFARVTKFLDWIAKTMEKNS